MNALVSFGLPADVAEILRNAQDPADHSDGLFRRTRFTFDNGYGLSLVKGPYSYGYELGLLDNTGSLLYEHPNPIVNEYFAGDVVGYIDSDIHAFAEMVRVLHTYQPDVDVLTLEGDWTYNETGSPAFSPPSDTE